MNISLEKIFSTSDYLNQIISLADENSNFLGFLPASVFREKAEKGNIIGAIVEDKCVGYLLFRIVKSKSKVSITHLCVNEKFRNNGIAAKLVTYLIENTKEWNGISLYCRRDFKSNKFWEKMGFRVYGEKPGRGKLEKTLTYYWYDHENPSLLKIANEMAIKSKPFLAVIDMNIFIEIFENTSHPLRANWLLEDLILCVTPELRNEINRDNNDSRRRMMINFRDNFVELPIDQSKSNQIYILLRNHYPKNISEQTDSDLLQLTHAIVNKANFFVTKDREINAKVKEFAYIQFGIKIVSVDNLILYFDNLINDAAYIEERLAGTLITISRVSSEEVDYLTEVFHRINFISKGAFRERISRFLSYPQYYDSYVVSSQNKEPIALIIIRKIDEYDTIEIPLLNIRKTQLSPMIESQLIFWLISQSSEQKFSIIKIIKEGISVNLVEAFRDNYFLEFDDCWFKVNYYGLHSFDSVLERIYKINENVRIKQILIENIQGLLKLDEAASHINFEKLLWPLKISDSEIPSYIVPIQASWAMELFDNGLGKQTLFGADPSLSFRLDNIYYRSASSHLPSAPSRILWYVSKGESRNHFGIMSIRACSYVDETIIGSPKIIFNKFSKLGIYRWENILSTAKNNIENEILTFRFSKTELFKNPIPLVEYKKLSGKKSAPMSPNKISNELFLKIYEIGMERD